MVADKITDGNEACISSMIMCSQSTNDLIPSKKNLVSQLQWLIKQSCLVLFFFVQQLFIDPEVNCAHTHPFPSISSSAWIIPAQPTGLSFYAIPLKEAFLGLLVRLWPLLCVSLALYTSPTMTCIVHVESAILLCMSPTQMQAHDGKDCTTPLTFVLSACGTCWHVVRI